MFLTMKYGPKLVKIYRCVTAAYYVLLQPTMCYCSLLYVPPARYVCTADHFENEVYKQKNV